MFKPNAQNPRPQTLSQQFYRNHKLDTAMPAKATASVTPWTEWPARLAEAWKEHTCRSGL